MKKTLLSILVLTSIYSASSQILQSEDFNSLPIGAIGTDATGTIPTNNYFTLSTNYDLDPLAATTATNAGPGNFQIVDLGDKSRVGMIEWRKFISSLRGDLPSNRKKIIKDVFDKLDKKREGFIPVTTIQTIFNGKNHPLVALGGGVNDDALEHFLFSTTMKTCRSKPLAYFTYEPFEDYYADLSIAMGKNI
jgi:hypothetical protein